MIGCVLRRWRNICNRPVHQCLFWPRLVLALHVDCVMLNIAEQSRVDNILLTWVVVLQSCVYRSVTFLPVWPMPMPRTVCTTHVYAKRNIVQLEVCKKCSGRGMGINIATYTCSPARVHPGAAGNRWPLGSQPRRAADSAQMDKTRVGASQGKLFYTPDITKVVFHWTCHWTSIGEFQ